jgi:type IV secretory pathway VirB2 component (pilin)
MVWRQSSRPLLQSADKAPASRPLIVVVRWLHHPVAFVVVHRVIAVVCTGLRLTSGRRNIGWVTQRTSCSIVHEG